MCEVDENSYLNDVAETSNIVKSGAGAEADKVIDIESRASMNMWGFTPGFMGVLDNGFKVFFKEKVPANPLKAEYLLPSADSWIGVIYTDDK